MPEFEVGPLDAYLKAAVPGLAGTPFLERISGGQSNPTYFVTYENRALVLRKQPPGPLLPSAHAIDREFRVIAALKGTGVPVPEALLFCDDSTIIGTPFYVMEKLEGRVFHDCALPGISPAERGLIYADIARVLAALHNVDPAAIGLGDFGRLGDYFTRQIGRWSRQWRENRTREDAAMERLIEWLPAHIPPNAASGIVHGDFRIGNLMIHPSEPRVIAILDWELATLGHPLADLAHIAMAWETRPEDYGGLAGLDFAALGLPSRAAFVTVYQESARHGARLEAFHRAFALFRWAAIFEGIAARARAGTASAGNAAEVGALAAIFSRQAAAIIDEDP